jgi:hypothetical protein
MRLIFVVLAVGCGSSGSPAPSPPPLANTPPPVATKQPPANTRGACRDNPKVGNVDDQHQPQTIASCPNVLEYHRGDGIGKTTGAPAMTKAITPDWDLVAMRDFACAYACARGSTASLSRGARSKTIARCAILRGVSRPTAEVDVVVMYRHAFNEWWNISTSFHSRSTPIVELAHKPTTDELTAALGGAGWSWTGDGRFKLLAGNVIDDVWPSRRPALSTLTVRQHSY